MGAVQKIEELLEFGWRSRDVDTLAFMAAEDVMLRVSDEQGEMDIHPTRAEALEARGAITTEPGHTFIHTDDEERYAIVTKAMCRLLLHFAKEDRFGLDPSSFEMWEDGTFEVWRSGEHG